ncbi:hypothetical protein PHET_01088 [Paragonimus heterotremus]|uniref:Uncharacterized protein n=1 Tax=Paragonimus heterotremus TaxID=100268 RepID=A0A8J4TNQ1_9TREM|nr:hypothetical protein PHET_01088 [Paragonimus heterotremus]
MGHSNQPPRSSHCPPIVTVTSTCAITSVSASFSPEAVDQPVKLTTDVVNTPFYPPVNSRRRSATSIPFDSVDTVMMQQSPPPSHHQQQSTGQLNGSQSLQFRPVASGDNVTNALDILPTPGSHDYLPRVSIPCTASPEAMVAAAAFNAVRRWFINPVSGVTDPPAAPGYWTNTLVPPSVSEANSTGTNSGTGISLMNPHPLHRFPVHPSHNLPPIAYMPAPHRGHHSSGYVPNNSPGAPLVRGGKKRSHSQSSVTDLFDISSLTRSSQGSLNIMQAMRVSRSMASSAGGSYGHLSAGTSGYSFVH